MALTPDEIRRGLERKGWRKKESHHTYYYLEVDGLVERVRTFVSHGKKEYGKGLLQQVKRQLKLDSIDELKRYIECTLPHSEYLEILERKGIIRKKK